MPNPDLGNPAAWPSDPYGDPDIEDAPARLRDRQYRQLNEPAAVPWVGNVQFILHPDDEQSHCLMKSGVYEPEGLAVLQSLLQPSHVFVDVGANSGIYTLFGCHRVGRRDRVIAFEPSEREFRRLRANIGLNGLDQATLHQAALSDWSGEATLLVANDRFSGHDTMASHFAYGSVDVHQVETVPVRTLDEIFAREPRCDMIKMDIEGHELRALRGAERTLARLRPVLLLEVYEAALALNGVRVSDLAAFLAAQGYQLHDIDRTGLVLPSPATLPEGVNKNVLARPL